MIDRLAQHHELIPGLILAADIIDSSEERALIEFIEACDPQIHSYDPANPRLSVTFGWLYDFETDSLIKQDPMPEAIRSLRDLVADFAGIEREEIVQCLLTKYEPGSVIQPHIDKPVWSYVIGISLGSATNMHFGTAKKDQKSIEIELCPRSIYVLTGDARHKLSHSIPSINQVRYSITFRTFSALGCQKSDSREHLLSRSNI